MPTASKTKPCYPGRSHHLSPCPRSEKAASIPQPGERPPKRTRLEIGAGRNVCAGRRHPPGRADHRTVLRRQVSATQVSRAAAELDGVLAAWRDRPLGEFRYVYLDARYESVRRDGQIRDVAVLLALGVDPTGKRHLLGVSVSLSEAEVHWRSFLKSLVARGLCGVRLLISDDHAGLKAARKAVFGGVAWQRCQFHLQHNAQAYVHKQEQKAPLAAAIRAIFNAANRYEAEALLAKSVAEWRRVNPSWRPGWKRTCPKA